MTFRLRSLLLEEFITTYLDVLETFPPEKDYCDMCNRKVPAYLWGDLYICLDCYEEVMQELERFHEKRLRLRE